ncbi:MAG: hypothetical protein ACFE9C_08060 [Candidatus Hodarchaeota archaeon]
MMLRKRCHIFIDLMSSGTWDLGAQAPWRPPNPPNRNPPHLHPDRACSSQYLQDSLQTPSDRRPHQIRGASPRPSPGSSYASCVPSSEDPPHQNPPNRLGRPAIPTLIPPIGQIELFR